MQLKQLDMHMQKSSFGLSSYSTDKNQLKMDQRPKHKS